MSEFLPLPLPRQSKYGSQFWVMECRHDAQVGAEIGNRSILCRKYDMTDTPPKLLQPTIRSWIVKNYKPEILGKPGAGSLEDVRISRQANDMPRLVIDIALKHLLEEVYAAVWSGH